PTFVNARSADLILSDVRPTSITTEALRAVNILLDEILWLTLANARSLDTTRVKVGVLKSVTTQLGKDAILEAEIEIRGAFSRDKRMVIPGSRMGRPSDSVLLAFPVQEAFEFLRLKCQLMSSFAEFDEDPELEAKLLERLTAKSTVPLGVEQMESSPLYFTAVIEYVLSSIARVVARDSSRTTADLTVIYASLCEDPLIYPFFKNMKGALFLAWLFILNVCGDGGFSFFFFGPPLRPAPSPRFHPCNSHSIPLNVNVCVAGKEKARVKVGTVRTED
ncbi:uncharacterized protein EI90DRAFT_2905792, partial [Cantharellus anzutake]|uniref:uncharacterized protein n=1 Tax=Cantharellus anzutake TaxID=1750568 RepID=UPI001907F7F8